MNPRFLAWFGFTVSPLILGLCGALYGITTVPGRFALAYIAIASCVTFYGALRLFREDITHD